MELMAEKVMPQVNDALKLSDKDLDHKFNL